MNLVVEQQERIVVMIHEHWSGYEWFAS